jgi:CubicO group peptidase (beta-lactamase class C family)
MEERAVSGPEAARSQLDRLVRDAKVPGLQYLVVRPKRFVFDYAGGWADLRERRQLKASTTLMAYSMSKTITAAAVLRLVGARTIRLDDPIDVYLESQPYGPGVTVQQLLAHTSGIPNPIPLRWVHPSARHDTFDGHAALARVLVEHPKLSFPPGTKYLYSNIGYWLLGRIVERASGGPFPAYVRDQVLKPLGITAQELGYVVPDYGDHAKGYLEKYSFLNLAKRFVVDKELIGDYEGRWLLIHDHYVNGAAFGGLVGSVTGFGKFLQDQLRPHSDMLGDATRELFFTPQCTKDGTRILMTLGWHIGRMNGVEFFYKEGGGGGFHCMMRVYRSAGIATVLMTNATGFDVLRTLNVVDSRFVLSTEAHH